MESDPGPWLELTPAQQGIFFAHQLDPGNPAYTTAEVIELPLPIDPIRLARAIDAAYAEFEQLRVAFAMTPEGPRQRVLRATPVELSIVDVADEGTATQWLSEVLSDPFDLLAGKLTRTGLLLLGGDRMWWWHAAHHVVLDGYGIQQLLRRVAELYGGATGSASVDLGKLVAEDHRLPESESFWDERLATMSGPVSLTGRIATPAPAAIRHAIDVPDDLQKTLVRGARELGTTWADLVTAAVGSYVARMLGVASGRIGLPLMNRSVPGIGQLLSATTVCTAMNVLPIGILAAGTWRQALESARLEQEAVRQHPFERQEQLARRLRRLTGGDLFGLQLNLIPFSLELDFDGVAGLVRNLTAGPVEDITLTLRGTPGRGRKVRLELDAHPDLYDEAALDLHLDRLLHWLEVCATAAPDADLATLPLLPEAEFDLVTRRFNDTAVERQEATLGARFLAQAARTPTAIALRFEGEERNYADLLDRARRIAGGLSGKGIRAGDVVGLHLSRGFALYEAIHAVALLGAVYLPVDPELPEARIAMMLEDASVALVITDDGSIDELAGAAPLLTPPPEELDAPAYLLFTSGSTGRPKGVLVSHRAIDNRLAWMQHHFGLTAIDRVLHKTPISFDVSVWELYWPLQVGASVVIAPPGAHRDPRRLATLIRDQRVTVLHFVPSMLRAFLADRGSSQAIQGSSAPDTSVRAVVTSGEALTPDLVAGCLERFGVAPTNLYGPTEAAIDVTVWDCGHGDGVAGRSVPIGRPVWNTSCFVLDPVGEPVAIGATGELWLGGTQLALGYVGRPDLTAERFVQTRWGRLYRTGDLAAWGPDGAVRYLGRTDDQVKVRGQRIELGEIEAVLAGVPGVPAVAAGVIDGHLVVWYAVEQGHEPSHEPKDVLARLRVAAAAVLPSSLMPSHWVPVDDIPLGTSGKTDRRRLAEIAPPASTEIVDGAVPRDLLEQRIARIIADLLGHIAVAADADFFALGGDSLSILRLLGRIEDEIGATVELADAFAAPTASGLATVITATNPRQRDDFSQVLTLRSGGDRAPLVLLPPAGGLGWCYTGLLADLPLDLPVHTVQAPGIAVGAPEPIGDLTALARRQLAAIRGIVGEGPFHVAGWSLGGMAAHAVATLARTEGQQVGSVMLLDAYPPEQWHHLAVPTESEALVGILRLAGLDAPDDSDLERTGVIELLRRSGSALAALPTLVLEGCITSVIEAAQLVRTEPPGVLPGDLTLVVATAPRPETHLDPRGWEHHVGGEVRIVEVAATHGELVRRPAATLVAQALLQEMQVS